MLIGIIGENCSGKSTLAEEIKAAIGAEIITGKDYLRMAKSESEAEKLFREKLRSAVSGENVIYVITGPEHLRLLPEGAVRILVNADLDTIKARFKARMHGNLPAPVEKMLEAKHGVFAGGQYDYEFDGVSGDAASLCEALKARQDGESDAACFSEGFQPAVRPLEKDEIGAALRLAWKVFTEFESPDYAPEGTEEFRKTLNDDAYLAGIRYYGAFDGPSLIGVLGIRDPDCHICFFFVEGQYHRRGVGTRLFERMREDCPGRTITLNSSPYGLPFYRRLGFTATAGEQTINGIRFTPMEYVGNERRSSPEDLTK